MANLFRYIIPGKDKLPFRGSYTWFKPRVRLLTTIQTWMKQQGLMMESLSMETLKLEPLIFDIYLVCFILLNVAGTLVSVLLQSSFLIVIYLQLSNQFSVNQYQLFGDNFCKNCTWFCNKIGGCATFIKKKKKKTRLVLQQFNKTLKIVFFFRKY